MFLGSRLLLLACFLLAAFNIKAQVQFANMPLQGAAGVDFYIVNYVDHDTTVGLLDNECGDKTYNSHTGTDFVLRSFMTMDSGVYVKAVANGRVFVTKDSLFDRNKHVNAGGFGNYIGINHSDLYYTYYAHLMKYSLLVQVGDSVVAGQNIAKVACSGNCTDPHVHLEVWDNVLLVDPFAGSCQTATSSLWTTQPAYDTSRKIIDLGFTPYVPNLDTLRERYQVRDTFYAGSDTTVNFWIQMQGLRAGDSLRTDWYSPGGTYWFSYTSVQDSDGWYYYYWTYINMPDTTGAWTTKFYINNSLVANRNFYVVQPSVVGEVSPATGTFDISPNPGKDKIFVRSTMGNPFVLANIAGKKIKEYPASDKAIDIEDLPKGMYLLKCGGVVRKLMKE